MRTVSSSAKKRNCCSGGLTSDGASNVSGVMWSNPIGKKKFKISYDFTWKRPARFTTSQMNDYCMFLVLLILIRTEW